jgi:hypothetical protein
MTTATETFAPIHERELIDCQMLLGIDKNVSFLFDSTGDVILRYIDGEGFSHWRCDIFRVCNIPLGQYPPALKNSIDRDPSVIYKLEALRQALDWDDNQKAFADYCRANSFPIGLRSLSVPIKIRREDNREREECVTLLAPQTTVRNPDEFQFSGNFDIDSKPPTYYLYARKKT